MDSQLSHRIQDRIGVAPGAAGAYGPGNHCSVLEACMCTRGYSCIASDDYRMNCDYAAPACAPLLDLAQIVIVLIVRGVFFGVQTCASRNDQRALVPSRASVDACIVKRSEEGPGVHTRTALVTCRR